MEPVEINNSFSFKTDREITLPESQAGLSQYAEKAIKAVELDETFTYIFLDTNVLLDYYGMSKSEKTKLLDFFQRNKDRIYLPHRVQIEFMNNRLGAIKKDLFNPLGQIYVDFVATCNEIKNKYKSYLETKKNILSNDFPDIWSELNETSHKLAQLMDNNELNQKIKDAVKETTEAHKNININDELLNTCSQFHLLPALSAKEINFLEKQYDDLAAIINSIKEPEKWKHVFPGSGDSGSKDYPYGDFLIYHEILKTMKSNNTDAIFLTNEKSKQDWMQKDKSPIVNYIQKSYLLTQRIMFIIHAESPLKVSFENIHKPTHTIKTLDSFAGLHPRYTYFVSNSETLEVKAEILREFALKYKEDCEFSYRVSEGVLPKSVLTALIDDDFNGPSLCILPANNIFEGTEEGNLLKQVYTETLELWCNLENIPRVGSEYLVFWRRSTKCKIKILEQFLEKYIHDFIEMILTSGSPSVIKFIASSSLGSASLDLPINPKAKDEQELVTRVYNDFIKNKRMFLT